MSDYLQTSLGGSGPSDFQGTRASPALSSKSSLTSQGRELVPLSEPSASFKLINRRPKTQALQNKFITFDIVTDLVGLAGLQKSWSELLVKCGAAHETQMSHAWHYSRCTALQGKLALIGYTGLAIIVGRYEGQVVMIWPLSVYDVLGVRQVKWIGEATKDYCDILLLEHPLKMQWLERGYKFLCDQIKPDLIQLKHTRQTGAAAQFLQQQGAYTHIPQKTAFSDLHDDSHWDGFGKHHRARGSFTIRRKRRLSDETSSYIRQKRYAKAASTSGSSQGLVSLIVDHEQKVTVCDYSLALSARGYTYLYLAQIAARTGLYSS